MTPIEEQQFKEYMESRINDVRVETYDQAMEFLRLQLLQRLPEGQLSKKDIDSEIRLIMRKWADGVRQSRVYH